MFRSLVALVPRMHLCFYLFVTKKKKKNSCHIKHYIRALISLCYASISALRHSQDK